MQTVLQAGLEPYLETHSVPPYQQKAAWDLLRCRTAALGGHTEECPDGHCQRVWYNSCRHRACPQCAFIHAEEWLEKKKEHLLGCDHFHVVFTVPQEFRGLWQWNPGPMGDLLFQTARDTLMDLLEDEAHLGARPGLLIALHTWGRTLIFHPHVHCLVTGGGLAPDDTWRPVRNGFLLPVRVVRLVYRGKFLQALEKLLRAGDLQLPTDLTLDGALALLKKAAAKKWNVRIQERYEHGRGVATYLARYMRGGPIKNSRILGHDDKSVCFRYRDHRASEGSGRPVEKTMTLSIEEFLGRLLLHVPLPGMQVVRGYGLYSRTDKERLEQCRSQLAALPGAGSPRPEKVRPVAEWAESLHRCPVCGKQMVRGESIARIWIPPPEAGE